MRCLSPLFLCMIYEAGSARCKHADVTLRLCEAETNLVGQTKIKQSNITSGASGTTRTNSNFESSAWNIACKTSGRRALRGAFGVSYCM
jgi:hypothetical protein